MSTLSNLSPKHNDPPSLRVTDGCANLLWDSSEHIRCGEEKENQNGPTSAARYTSCCATQVAGNTACRNLRWAPLRSRPLPWLADKLGTAANLPGDESQASRAHVHNGNSNHKKHTVTYKWSFVIYCVGERGLMLRRGTQAPPRRARCVLWLRLSAQDPKMCRTSGKDVCTQAGRP